MQTTYPPPANGRPRWAQPAYDALVFEAKGLISAGENPEYDRAIIELATMAGGGTQDDFPEVCREVFGINRPDLWAMAPARQGGK